MSTEVEQIAVLVGFVLLMTWVNIKAGGSWSGAVLKWATYVLLVAGIAVLTFKVWEVVS